MSDPPAGGEFSIFSECMKFGKHEANHGELFWFFCSHKRISIFPSKNPFRGFRIRRTILLQAERLLDDNADTARIEEGRKAIV